MEAVVDVDVETGSAPCKHSLILNRVLMLPKSRYLVLCLLPVRKKRRRAVETAGADRDDSSRSRGRVTTNQKPQQNRRSQRPKSVLMENRKN